MDEKFKSFIGTHITAVDLRILALSNLLMKKGIITEKEIQDSNKEVFKVMTYMDKVPEELTEELKVFLKDFFQLD